MYKIVLPHLKMKKIVRKIEILNVFIFNQNSSD